MTAGEVIMIGLTAISAVGAVIAGIVAKKAEANAARADLTARDANAVARKANDLATESNTIAQSARDDARNAVLDVAWDELIVAFAPLLTVIPHREERFQEHLTATRARMTVLIDRLEGWEHFDEWVSVEWRLGTSLGREALGAAHAGMSPDDELAITDKLHTWAVGFNTNLRWFRSRGYDAGAIDKLLSNARSQTAQLYARNDWPELPDSLPGLTPLD